MISDRVLTKLGLKSLQEAFERATEHLIADRPAQARHLILAMSKEQKKLYLLHVYSQYPTNKELIEFILTFI